MENSKRIMFEKKTWEEFQKTGLLWWLNRQLHLFGWSIVVVADDSTGELLEIYPARSSWRGFDRDVEEEQFETLTKYLNSVAPELEKEVSE